MAGSALADERKRARDSAGGSDGAAADARDPLAAVAAFLAASPAAQALFAHDGRCIAATPAFTRRMAASQAAAKAEGDGTLREDALADADVRSLTIGIRTLRLVTLAAPAAAPVDAVLRTLLDSVPAMISAKDLSSRYLFMNAFQARLYGTTPEAARGRTAGELLGAQYGSYTAALDRRVIETGRAILPIEEEYEGADGVKRNWLTLKVPLQDAGGRHFGVGTVALEITDRKRLEHSLLETKKSAEAASQAKTLFLAQMSHELRTPLNAVIGFTEMMTSEIFGPLGAAQYKGYAQDVLKAARHLLGIITDMLDLTRLDAGALALDLVPVALGDIVVEVARMMGLPASTKRVALRLYVEPSLPRLNADSRRLRQSLINLVGNAIKFTPEGGSVTFGARRSGDGLELFVEDSGVGMSSDEVETAMTVFGRAGTGYAKSQDGAGIGLPLAKALVERHGGDFIIDSAPGRGTKVRAVFPALCLADAAAPPAGGA